MYKHYIVMSSAYSIRKKIELDYLVETDKDIEKVGQDVEYISKHSKNDVHLYSHYIQVEKPGWNAVEEYDAFFKDVEVVKSRKKFIELINADRDLKGIDVARYILSKVPCTHLKLEKLVYFAYADYLCKTNKKLFTDNIYAFKLGPIIPSVYNKYKKTKEVLSVKQEVEDNEIIEDESKKYMPIRSKIMSSKDGIDKVFSIDKTIETYGDKTANQLVEITHKENTPWRNVGYTDKKKAKIIKDKTIYNFHKNEILPQKKTT